MANIKNLPADLKLLPSFPCNGSRYYYKVADNGSKQLVAQVFGKSHYVLRYPAGTTIDTVPDNSVNSSSIIDGSIQSQDLSDEMKDKLRVSYDNEEGGIKIGGL
jgi:hypothetical protein